MATAARHIDPLDAYRARSAAHGADCTALRPSDTAYRIDPTPMCGHAGFAKTLTVAEVREHTLIAGGDTFWRDSGRRLSRDPGSRTYLSPVLPAGMKLLGDALADRIAA